MTPIHCTPTPFRDRCPVGRFSTGPGGRFRRAWGEWFWMTRFSASFSSTFESSIACESSLVSFHPSLSSPRYQTSRSPLPWEPIAIELEGPLNGGTATAHRFRYGTLEFRTGIDHKGLGPPELSRINPRKSLCHLFCAFTFEIKLANKGEIVVTSDSTKGYDFELNKIQLEYCTIRDEGLSGQAASEYQACRTFVFDNVHLFQTIPSLKLKGKPLSPYTWTLPGGAWRDHAIFRQELRSRCQEFRTVHEFRGPRLISHNWRSSSQAILSWNEEHWRLEVPQGKGGLRQEVAWALQGARLSQSQVCSVGFSGKLAPWRRSSCWKE